MLMVLPARPAGDGFPGGMEAAMDLAALIEMIECNDLARLPLLLDDGELSAVTLDELKDAAAWIEPWRRFLYSWSFNFAAIGSKALLEALSQATESEGEASSLLQRGPYDRREGRRLLESTREWAVSASASMGPLELQVLYRLRRLGRVDASHCIGPYGVQGMPVLSAILPKTSGGFEWTGTGNTPRYPSIGGSARRSAPSWSSRS